MANFNLPDLRKIVISQHIGEQLSQVVKAFLKGEPHE
jgi:hypothetical protein